MLCYSSTACCCDSEVCSSEDATAASSCESPAASCAAVRCLRRLGKLSRSPALAPVPLRLLTLLTRLALRELALPLAVDLAWLQLRLTVHLCVARLALALEHAVGPPVLVNITAHVALALPLAAVRLLRRAALLCRGGRGECQQHQERCCGSRGLHFARQF
eukprot:1712839-Prymnesium_polylepis.2